MQLRREEMELNQEIKYIKGVGPKMAEELNKISIFTVLDLLLYFPKSYESLSSVNNIESSIEDEKVVIKCRVVGYERDVRTTTGKILTSIILSDGINTFKGKWYNQIYIKNSFLLNHEYILSGKAEKYNNKWSLSNPKIIRNSTMDKENIMVKYPLRGRVTNNFLNKIISNLLCQVDINENMPMRIINKYDLCPLNKAIRNIHSPKNTASLAEARKRLKFQELFAYSMKILMLRDYMDESSQGITYIMSKELSLLKESLPFELTKAQSRVIREILMDQKNSRPMNRLVQGDVGSGKTIVAIIAMFNVAKNGYQAAMMVPTEILAKQHYIEVIKLLEKFNIRVEILVGSTTKKNKGLIKEKLKSGEIDIIIGTHALIEDDVEFKRLGLVITDEQHRFGVNQRCRFCSKGENIDVLVMTATPIPRTLNLYLYGDLDLSIIDELPPGRQNIITDYVNKNARKRVYALAQEQINLGRQVYIVCPLVEESEELKIKSVEELYAELKEEYFRNVNIAMLHGKMKSKDKESIMNDFKENITKVLISTTVIEVGVNVPNATVMIIESAERFGLAQLHQLRGRVGRGEYQSYCMLVADIKSNVTKKRMDIMKRSTDGFLISDEDLKIRGAGEIFGFKQSGDNELILADIVEDLDIVKLANNEARELIDSKDQDDIRIKKEILSKIEKSSTYICYN
ncbi:MAG: ATP-dependent DNA helicase RecG [Clostridium sp.]